MASKKHITQSGLEEIICLKGALNLGLSEKLKLAFSHVKITPRPEFVVNEDKLNPRVSGFTEGDGSFSFSITDKKIQATYSIGVHCRDKPLLLKIREFFGSKSNVRVQSANSVQFLINGISELNTVLIPHFRNYPLSGQKLSNYNIWGKIVGLLANKAHLTEEGRIKLRELKSSLNKY